MQHGKGSRDSYKKRIGLLEHRSSKLSRVSEHMQFVTRHVLMILSSQDNKASSDGVQRTLSTLDVLLWDIKLVSGLTDY